MNEGRDYILVLRRDWGDGSMGKNTCFIRIRTEFKLQHPCEKPGMATNTCNPGIAGWEQVGHKRLLLYHLHLNNKLSVQCKTLLQSKKKIGKDTRYPCLSAFS